MPSLRLRTAAAHLALALALAPAPRLAAQDFAPIANTGDGTLVPIDGSRLGGFVLPIEPYAGDLTMRATQAWVWTIDDTKRLLLRGDVEVRVGGNSFRADEAAIWINRLPSSGGLINQVAVYFDRASTPTQRAGLSPQGRDLLVTSSARGGVSLSSPFVEETRPPQSALLVRGERRLSEHLRRLVAEPPALAPVLQVDQPAPPPPPPTPVPGGSGELRDDQMPSSTLPSSIRLPDDGESPRLFDPRGLIGFSGGAITIDERADQILLEKGIVVEYVDEESSHGPRRLSLTAQRAVVYLEAGTLATLRSGTRQVGANRVSGIYLEGDVVATDGAYTIRGNRIYYDVPGNRALIADAVLRTYSRGGRMPVVARAEEMRQLSRDAWTAKRAVVSTSEFFTPHIGLGAKDISITRPPLGSPGRDEIDVLAQSVTMRAGNVPFFYWPRVAARSGDVPLRSLSGGYSDQYGAKIETQWDLLALAGAAPNDRLDAVLRVDGYSKRGAALGTKLRYDFLGAGNLELYGMYDQGEDLTSSGRTVEPDTEWRGVVLGEHRARLDEHWTLDVQASWISDQTFITSWRENDFSERREYETSAYLLRQQDNHALSLLAKYDLNGFISNEWLLGSRAYTIERLPEGSYRRVADDLGGITWTQEWEAARMRLLGTKGTPASLGVPGAAFGLPSNANIRQAQYAQGYRGNAIGRFQTRHELSLPFEAGPFKLAPFASGQFIGYMEDQFAAFSSDADDIRFLAATGLRASTQFQRVDDSVENRFFDLHRLRHIIEPGMTAWSGYSKQPSTAYPIYDEDIEGIDGTTALDVHVKQTFQTQRGGPGRWQSVDFLVVDLGGVLTTNDANMESPVPQFFRWRPELSRFGDSAYGSGIWQLTDTFALAGSGIWDMENDDLARGSVGVELNHSPALTTFVEYRTITAEDSDLIEVGWDYRISKKYRVVVAPQIDLANGGLRAANFALVRDFPDFYLLLSVGYDKIQDETTFSATLRPVEF